MAYRTILATGLLAFATSFAPAHAATMADCASQWQQLKASGQQGTQTYRDFSKACMAGGAAPTTQAAAPAPAAAVPPKPPTQVAAAPVGADDTPSSAAAKKVCDSKWSDRKQQTGEHGYKAYFTFMSGCL
jgi:hypothetical protein